MGRASDQFRSSDVTVWGIVAMVCGGLAVLSANLSALVPPNVLAGLHASRLDGATVNQLRSQVAALQLETARMRRENAEMNTRILLAHQASGEVMRRVGALEVSVPLLLEENPGAIDRSAVTASITEGETITFEAEGGTVTVQQRPLVTESATPSQAMPPVVDLGPAIAPDPSSFGIALGPVVSQDGAPDAWSDLNRRAGMLLLGLAALSAPGDGGRRIVAGPLTTLTQAEELCGRLAMAGIECAPMPFVGVPLASPN